jgi:hypothetical protein
MVPWISGSLLQLLNGDLWRRKIRVAEAEVNDVIACSPALDLELVDDREHVWGQVGYAAKFHGGVSC